MNKFISIKEASILIGVTTTTLRRWEKDGKFISNHRTLGNHRRYNLKHVLLFINPNHENKIKKTICYSRVSSHDQKEDLSRQINVLKLYANDNHYKNK